MKWAKNITMRHEEKYVCSEGELNILESRLKGVLDMDENQTPDGYEIRSLYFDTVSDRFYEEGLEGLAYRSKYRVRMYNGNADVLKLEKKTSINNLKSKKIMLLEKSQVESFIRGEVFEDVDCAEQILLKEVCLLQKTMLLRPKIIVKYNRKAFVSDIGNVRITLDRNICVSNHCEDFLREDGVYHPVMPPNIHLLEVKYDGILPGYISKVLNTDRLERTSFSKYILGVGVMKNNGRMKEIYEL